MRCAGIEADALARQPVALHEILAAFSYALDLTEGQPQGHCIRSCFIGLQVGRRIGLSDAELKDLYYVLLLKDLGCSSNAARICGLYLTDDLAFKRDFKRVGGGITDALGFVFSHTGRAAPVGARAKAIINILRNGGEIARQLVETRCTRGADIARRLRFPDAVANGIYSLDEHWDGSGKPHGLSGADIPLYARIALLAQVVDVFNGNAGPAAARAEVEHRSGTWFDPALVRAFADVAGSQGFWTSLASPTLEAELLASAPAQELVLVDEDYLDDIAAAFGEVVDAKSPYTAGHSSRVADYVEALMVRLDYGPARRGWLRRGALLHDIGKLGVSNAILDKPGKLDDDEWAAMRGHAAYTETILSRISVMRDIAPLAAAHHERLDGRGYPKGLGAEDIPIEARIITICDFFDALTAARPYRGAMSVEQALGIIRENVGTAVDAACFAALEDIAASSTPLGS